MDLYQLILKRRTIRKFRQDRIPLSILKKIVNAGRLAPSAGNLQFIEYVIVRAPKLREKLFPHTRWAAYLSSLGTPSQTERPTSYIAIIINYYKSASPDLRDVGAAVENMILASLCFQIGSCWLGAIEKEKIAQILKLPSHCQLDSLLALGYPAEAPRVKTLEREVRYWRTKTGQHIVPKRPLKNICYINFYGNRS